MLVFILKFIFFITITLSNLFTRLIFSITAYLLLLIIQAVKVPGEAVHGALEQLGDAFKACFASLLEVSGDAVKACFEKLLEVLMEAVDSIISSIFDLLVEGMTESIALTGSAMGGLAEKSRDSLDVLMKSLPEIIDGFWEMVSTIVKDLWDNYLDALVYVTENA